MAGNICDCCLKETETHVRCSGLGVVSFAYCLVCLEKLTEPEFMFEYLYSDVGNKGEGLKEDFMNEFTTYKNGNYITWEIWKEWRKYNG